MNNQVLTETPITTDAPASTLVTMLHALRAWFMQFVGANATTNKAFIGLYTLFCKDQGLGQNAEVDVDAFGKWVADQATPLINATNRLRKEGGAFTIPPSADSWEDEYWGSNIRQVVNRCIGFSPSHGKTFNNQLKRYIKR